MRWFISYQYIIKEFLAPKTRRVTHNNIVVDITPAQWIAKQGTKYNILYAEQISHALASELVHGGAGVSVEYSDLGE